MEEQETGPNYQKAVALALRMDIAVPENKQAAILPWQLKVIERLLDRIEHLEQLIQNK